MPMRLNKFLAHSLGLSRREADDLIAAGKVKVKVKVGAAGARAEIARLGRVITDEDEVFLEGKPVLRRSGYTYLALNKPTGYVSSRKGQGERPTLYEILPEEFRRLKTVGRLDADSSGLLLLTDDGDFAFKMTHPSFAKVKIYEVLLDRPLSALHQQMIADFGLELPDGRSQLGLERMDDSGKSWRVTMREGRNRQIRRTFAALGYTVIGLNRTSFGPYKLDGMGAGEWKKVDKI